MAGPTQSDIDLIAQRPVAAGRLLIDGRWHEGEGHPSEVLSPIDGSVLTTGGVVNPTPTIQAVLPATAGNPRPGFRLVDDRGTRYTLHPMDGLTAETPSASLRKGFGWPHDHRALSSS